MAKSPGEASFQGLWRHERLRLAVPFGLSLLAGCGHFWDDITAKHPEGGFQRNMQYKWELLTHRGEPLQVLATCTDGDLRARAYKRLKEPMKHGGTQAEQDAVLNVLATAAKSERDSVCRLAATEQLGSFKDPRAVQALINAFYEPANLTDRNPVVRIAAIESLAQIGDPAGLETVTQAAARDPAMDVRIAAARSLRSFKSPDATGALVRILREEKDLALRYEANQSLQKLTGKDLPARAEAWEVYLQNPDADKTAAAANPFIKLAGWMQGK